MKTASWFSVEGIDLDQSPRVEAIADRSANTITIEADSVSSVMVFFNDSLVDMDRPVKVIVNGNVNEASLQRNQRNMLDLAWSQGDWGRVFMNFQVYDVPTRQ